MYFSSSKNHTISKNNSLIVINLSCTKYICWLKTLNCCTKRPRKAVSFYFDNGSRVLVFSFKDVSETIKPSLFSHKNPSRNCFNMIIMGKKTRL